MENIRVIPRTKYFLKFLEVPSLEEGEIKKMVELQLVKDTPFSSEEVIYGFRKLGSYRDGYSYIMLAGSSAEEARSAYYRNTPIHTELLYLYCLENGLFSSDRTDFIIHIGKRESEVMVVDKSKVVFSRAFDNSPDFLSDIDKTMLAYKRDKGHPDPEKVTVMYHSEVDMEAIKPHITGHFGIPVNFHEYHKELSSMAPSSKIRLLPKEMHEKKKDSDRKREFMFTAVFTAVIFFLLSAMLGYRVLERKNLSESLSEKSAVVKSKTQDLEELAALTGVMDRRLKESRLLAEAVGDVRDIVPEDLFISGVDYEEGTITYKGYGMTMEDITVFSDLIREKDFFDSVRITQTGKKNLNNREITEFTLTCKRSEY